MPISNPDEFDVNLVVTLVLFMNIITSRKSLFPKVEQEVIVFTSPMVQEARTVDNAVLDIKSLDTNYESSLLSVG